MKSATYSRLESNEVEWGWWEEYTILSYPFSLSNTWFQTGKFQKALTILPERIN